MCRHGAQSQIQISQMDMFRASCPSSAERVQNDKPWWASHQSRKNRNNEQQSNHKLHQLEGLEQALGTLKPMDTSCCRHRGVQCRTPPAL